MRSKGELPDDGEHNYGMMTWDFYPKAVYAAYNGLTGLYHDKDFERACELPWGEWAFVFKNDRELAVALWNDGEDDIPRVFRTDAVAAEIVDIFGNRQALPVIDGTVLVTTTNEPQTLLLRGAKSTELLPPLSSFAMPELLLPGQPQPMTVVLANPFAEARQATVKLTLPPTVTASQSQFSAQVAPYSQAKFAATLTLTTAPTNSLVAKEWVMAEGQLAGMEPVRQMHLLPVPFRFPSRLAGEALFTLADHTKITQLFVGDPAKEDSTWKGAQDLSAKVWLAIDDQALSVKVVATDDQHCQKNTAAQRSWDGDGIQLFLMPSGLSSAVEMDFAREEDGRSHVFLRRLPPGIQGDEAALRLATERAGTQTTYVITVPFAAIGSTAEAFARGFRFNLMVNDADNGIREGWVQVAPGIGTGTVNTQIMPVLLAQ
ncbi:MAG: sugar-binding protein, partial [Lentisphaeria bacterium]|nr:sugar-binding protein [Lentisphaeria bacterium]